METLITILIIVGIIDIVLNIELNIFNNHMYREYKDVERRSEKAIEEWRDAVKVRDAQIEILNRRMMLNITVPDGKKFEVTGQYEGTNETGEVQSEEA